MMEVPQTICMLAEMLAVKSRSICYLNIRSSWLLNMVPVYSHERINIVLRRHPGGAFSISGSGLKQGQGVM